MMYLVKWTINNVRYTDYVGSEVEAIVLCNRLKKAGATYAEWRVI